ncbi:MAG: methyltransferase domain-containing protein [Desulfarculaceae bacterium]|nr:methyltransferase domain-containing protein [Desulfarculaceae bacterium]
MTDPETFEERYKTENTPWELGRVDANLVNILAKRNIKTGRVLDVGCGIGTCTIWLAENGYKITGIDVSGTAIRKAKEKARKKGISATFHKLNFLKETVKERPFDFLFDRGCFHSFDSGEDRGRFAENAAFHLKDKGLWFCIAGISDDEREGKGPPKRSATEIVTAVEPFFEIQFIASGLMDSDSKPAPKAWICLMQKR